ncbi:MAG: hypothetical protein DVB31_06895 [Verrucomicrobia bacterium]|nr:MAG: hypothetical protein DVB31_06895 [Verrucomicrobiota bacterium]
MSTSSFPRAAHALVFAAALASAATAADRVTVDAGPRDRAEAVVEIALPTPMPGGWNLVAGDGTAAIPLQTDGDGHGWFVLRDLPRGKSRTYSLKANDTPGSAAPRIRAVKSPGAVRLEVGGKPALTYRTTPTEFPPDRGDLTPIFRRGGYIHPVLTPAGLQVTDDYPANHRHHHGIWFAWSHAEFEGRPTDTWNMGDGKGTVEFTALETTWDGAVHGGFRARHRQVDLTSGKPRVALEEIWSVRLLDLSLAPGRGAHVFDVDVTDSCAGTEPFRLPEYRYGGIGVRGNWAWNGPAALRFLNSEGVTDRSKGDKNQTTGRWAYLGGPLPGGWAGIAILGHPANALAPQPQRIHPTEPFLCLAPQQAGALAITPGKPLRSRYRFVAFDGDAVAGELERLWQDYAEPPVARVE